jgi:TatD DNase family protein
MKIFDTHIHFYISPLTTDQLQDFVGHDYKAICVGIDKQTSLTSLALAKLHKNIIYPSFGIHPSEAKKDLDFAKEISDINFAEFVAIGECGLDYHYTKENKAEQMYVFKKQIELSLKLNLPLIIHTRDAQEDTLAILNSYNTTFKGVMHCFGGDEAMVKESLRLGFYISFAGNVTYNSAGVLRNCAKLVPLDRLLIETDGPFLAPQLHRGEKNRAFYIIDTAQFLANYLNIDLVKFLELTNENAHRLFLCTN